MRALDEAAAYLHGRITMAKRAVSLSGQSREEALQRTLKVKQSRDQVASMLEKGRVERRRRDDDSEKRQLDELVTSRYAMTLGGL